MLDDIQKPLMDKLLNSTLTTSSILKRFYSNKENSQFYWAFWHYLGEMIQPKRILSVGGDLCLEASCACRKSEVVLYEAKNPRFATKNIKISGGVLSNIKSWDLAIIHNEYNSHLDFIWNGMVLDGLICVINAGNDFQDFAKVKNREPIYFELKHVVGVIQK
jgi:hypothetical protein